MPKSYTELQQLDSLEDRFDYLSLGGEIGTSTFGFDRWINQAFYHSREWKDVRSYVIARDDGLDLGARGSRIGGGILVHHMNPVILKDIEEATENLLNPEYLITTSLRTHNAIHWGDKRQLPQPFVERRPGDTKLW